MTEVKMNWLAKIDQRNLRKYLKIRMKRMQKEIV